MKILRIPDELYDLKYPTGGQVGPMSLAGNHVTLRMELDDICHRYSLSVQEEEKESKPVAAHDVQRTKAVDYLRQRGSVYRHGRYLLVRLSPYHDTEADENIGKAIRILGYVAEINWKDHALAIKEYHPEEAL